MKLPLFLLLALATLCTGWHRALEVCHPTARFHLGIESFGARGYMVAFYVRSDWPDDIPAALLFLKDSTLCVSCNGRELLVLEWNGSGHLFALLKIGGGRYA